MGQSKTSKYYAANPEARKKRLAYQKVYNKKKSEVKNRMALNKENRERGTYGNGDGLDVSHMKNGKTKLEKACKNRSDKGKRNHLEHLKEKNKINGKFKITSIKVQAITPSDTADIPSPGNSLETTGSAVFFITVAGDVKMTTSGDDTVTMTLEAGWHPINVKRIWDTGTTATGIFGGW